MGVALVLGVAVAVDSVSCPLFTCPSAATPPPSPAIPFRMLLVCLVAYKKHL